jgi:hypothetical protein
MGKLLVEFDEMITFFSLLDDLRVILDLIYAIPNFFRFRKAILIAKWYEQVKKGKFLDTQIPKLRLAQDRMRYFVRNGYWKKLEHQNKLPSVLDLFKLITLYQRSCSTCHNAIFPRQGCRCSGSCGRRNGCVWCFVQCKCSDNCWLFACAGCAEHSCCEKCGIFRHPQHAVSRLCEKCLEAKRWPDSWRKWHTRFSERMQSPPLRHVDAFNDTESDSPPFDIGLDEAEQEDVEHDEMD